MFICFTPLRDWLFSQSLFCMALLLHFTLLSILSAQLHGGPLWGELAGSSKSLCESGSEHEKNVGRPRAAAVAPRESLSEALVCIVYIFYWYEVPRLSWRSQIALIVISDSNFPCSRLAKVTSLYRYCVYQISFLYLRHD